MIKEYIWAKQLAVAGGGAWRGVVGRGAAWWGRDGRDGVMRL